MKKIRQETTKEFLERLSHDPSYVARRAEGEREFEERERELRVAEAPLVEALSECGVLVGSVWDLIGRKARYPAGISVLLEHLQKPYPSRIREGIARALAVPEAKWCWRLLVEHYRAESDPHVKEGLAAAVSAASDERVLGELIGLAKDRSLGSSRLLLLWALERTTDPRGRAALVELEGDTDLAKEVKVSLRRLRRKVKL
jgi:hypothetical protein